MTTNDSRQRSDLSDGLGLPRMEQLLAFCDWERTHNPPRDGKQHIAEWAAAEIDRLHRALQWLESKARAGKIEIAPSLLGTGFEFGFWPQCSARVVNAKNLLDAVEAAQRA